MQKALITGGAGFIGSHIADRLKKTYSVHVLDNLATGDRSYVPEGVTFYEEDIRNTEAVISIVKKIRPDVIFHIAGQASNINSFTDPHFDIDVNYKGTVNMVMAALEAKVPRFLHASSMTVYGPPGHLPVAETEPCKPVSYYGISKYAAERFVHATAIRPDLKTPFHATSFRMFNVYGPRQSLTNPYQGVLGIFIGHVVRNEPVTIFGDGLQSRDFIYIDDVVDAWNTAINKQETFGEVYNLGSGIPRTIKETIDMVVKAYGKNPTEYPVIYEEKHPGEQRHMQAAMEKLTKDLGIRPTTPFGVGLARTLEWASHAGPTQPVVAHPSNTRLPA